MDIRLAQQMAWDTRLAKGMGTGDVSMGFGLLRSEVAKALEAWGKGCREMAEELAGIAIFLLRLAEMVGTDLQDAIEAKLGESTPKIHGQPPNGKLVRDKIPQIIRSKGQEPVIKTADTEEYCIRLRDKLREEVEEYLASDNDREELADILEVLYALARQAGTDKQQLEKLRAAKAEKRGGFADRIIWFCNQPPATAQEMRVGAAKL
jgi:predicted house-cleaning noncanonical NTP pyrophosphatase (MazG superfamily)